MHEFLTSPVLWVTVSLVVYVGARALYVRAGTPLVHPVLLTHGFARALRSPVPGVLYPRFVG